MTNRLPFRIAALVLASAGPLLGQSPSTPPAAESFAFKDQFDREHRVGDHAGEVLVLVYGDRRATEPCRRLGEALHVAFHPTAAALPRDRSHLAPVRPLDGSGGPAPEVRVVPVACTGYVPDLVRPVVRDQIRKGCPVVPVWLDFDGGMASRFGLQEGLPHVVVFDGTGRVRLRAAGELDPGRLAAFVETVEGLRREIAAAP